MKVVYSEFAGKAALVTGGSRGIGRSIVLGLAGQGANVYFTYLSSEEAAVKTVSLVSDSPGNAHAIKLDGRDTMEVNRLLGEILGREPVPYLVNNAGTTRDLLFSRMSEDDLHEVMKSNLYSMFNVTKAILPNMVKEGFGRIVNLSSVTALVGNIGQANYSASKAAVVAFSKSIAKEYARKNILVNVVIPGLVDTDMTKDLPQKVREELIKQIPLGKFAEPEDVADAVLFLLSSSASYITGATLNVNGGGLMV